MSGKLHAFYVFGLKLSKYNPLKLVGVAKSAPKNGKIERNGIESKGCSV